MSNRIADTINALAQINAALPQLLALGQTLAGALSRDAESSVDAARAVERFRLASQQVRESGEQWLRDHPAL